ncbi:MAG: glycosyltransferase family 2 protein [Gammaproteobacteria bacterium]|nr:glycosyltransferase family 2 protein [Gammaproteobacteria bacterium]
MIRRLGTTEGLISFILPGVFYSVAAFIIGYSMWPYFYYIKNETFIVLGTFALWRYGWQVVNYTRSTIYALRYYPKLRRVALGLSEEKKYPRHIFFIIPSYKEEPWVSIEAFQSLMSNLSTIPCSATLVVSTGSDRDDAVIAATYEAHPVKYKVELVLQRQCQGKRIAMGHALRAVARRYQDDPNSVTVFMDGDSYLEQHTLNRTLPFFAAFKDLGALTTNELAYIHTRSQWYKDWFNLKFGQRHVLFQSHALSNKVLTLTGRFSLFRTSIVVKEDFIKIIECDVITHWLHGKFRFLMGDDKSSWFYLLKHKWNMLYIPDVTCYSLESRDASFLTVSVSLPYRWYGNTLRNNARALALGWRHVGLFIWIAILDQRLSMWTSLVGITGAVILSISKSFIYLPFYMAWVFSVRVLQMFIIALRGHPVSMLTIPLMLYNQWVGAIIKIRAYFNLADQKWSKGGAEQSSAGDVVMIDHPWVRWMPRYLMLGSYSLFAFALLLTEGAISMPGPEFFYKGSKGTVIQARLFGVTPNDNMDDSLALQQIIDRVPKNKNVLIQMPAGTIDLFHALHLRSHITLAGEGADKTFVMTHMRRNEQAAISLHGNRGSKLTRLLRDIQATDKKIVLGETSRLVGGDLLLLRTPNDASFMKKIGSLVWNREYPYLRQTIVRVQGVTGGEVSLETTVGIALLADDAEVYKINPVAQAGLKDFSIEHIIEGVKPRSVWHVYENSYPEYAVDSISAKWASDCKIENIRIHNSGRHPLAFDSVYACRASGLVIEGAWNKGKKGNGYVKFSRSYHSSFEDSRVDHIRHIVLQWSSAFNTIKNIDTGVDINLHGGYSHDNIIRDIRFNIPAQHPWKGVVHTPANATWAPPDGKNQVLIAD